jgi:hypothetical protein
MGRINRIILVLAACAWAAGSLRAEDLPLPPLPGGNDVLAPPSTSPLGGQARADELVKLQAQVQELLEQAHTVKDNQDRLGGQLDRLLNATGVRFGGEAVMDSDNFLRLNPLANAQRVWPTVGYFDFHITAHPRSDLQADVIYRMEKIFGGFWGSLDIAGVRYFNIKGETPIGFEVGMVNYKHTPLTFWAPTDTYEFEPEIQARKRREGMDQVYVKDNSFPMNGVKLDATLLLFSKMDLDLEALGFRTAIAGNKNTGLGFAVTFPFDQYIVGTTARLTGDSSKALSLGASYFELMESVDTAQSPALSPQQRGNVVGADLKLSLMGDAIVLRGEGAQSNYTPAYGSVLSWTTGTGGNVMLDLSGTANKLSLYGLYVEETFINYMAQTRVQDTMREPSGDIATGNNLYNPHTGDYTLTTVNNLYFNRYNSVVFATNQGPTGGLVLNKFGMQPAALLLTHGFLSESLPEGFATPNRSGYGGDYSGKFFGGLLQPRLLGGMYQEIYTAYNVPTQTGPRKYSRGGGGLKIDLAPTFGLPLDLQAGVVVEDTRSDSFVAFTSTRIGYDMHWQLSKDFHLLLGFQHTDYNGADFFDFGASSGPTWTYENWLIDDYLGGFDWILSKSTEFTFTYSFVDAIDADNISLNPAPNFQDQEYQAKLRMRF